MLTLDHLDCLKPIKDSSKFKVYLSGDSVTKTWRTELLEDLEDTFEKDHIILLNSGYRGVDYKEHVRDPYFKTKVKWELEAAAGSDLIYFHFSEDSPCPLALIEFGMYVSTKPTIISCEPGFWKRGYVEMLASIFNKKFTINTVEAWGDLTEACEQYVLSN